MRVTSRNSICTLGFILAAGLAAAPAGAHEAWAKPGGFYLDIAGGVEWLDLPELTAFNTLGDEFGSTDDELGRWTTQATFGYVDRGGMSLPDPIGQNARIEGRVRYAFGTSDAHSRSDVDQLRMQFVNDPTSGYIFGLGANARFNTSFESWDADLLYRTDVVINDVLAISPLIGLTYTRIDFDNDYKGQIGFARVEINDDTTTDYYGLALGTDISVRPIDALEITLGVRGDFMGASAQMAVNQDNLADPANPFRQSDGDGAFAARGTASLGIGLTAGRFTLGVEGYASYLSYLATAEHPTNPSDGVSRIAEENLWGGGVNGSLTIWFW